MHPRRPGSRLLPCTTLFRSTWQDLPRYVWRHSPQEEEAEEEGRRGGEGSEGGRAVRAFWVAGIVLLGAAPDDPGDPEGSQDRKSTRLNSSHITISYAVFCLK